MSNDWRETLDWYENHTTTSQIGFNPDGMCLKVCRTARDIPSLFPSAVVAQNATPLKHRITDISLIRKGMVMYFDDPNDSNRFGHVAGVEGRVRGADRSKLSDLLLWTNSVVSGKLVLVRGDYFQKHWGDPFVFAATWLNGVVLDVPAGRTRIQKFHASGPHYNFSLLEKAVADGRSDCKKSHDEIISAVRALPSDKDVSLVKRFKRTFRKNRVLEMTLLNKAVANGRTGDVKKSRDRINQAIKRLPRA